ncbi:MAG: SMI1/KNR4 family protein [Blastocatellales bacterium]
MNERAVELVRQMGLNPGAKENEIRKLEAALRVELPHQYVEFMSYTNGVEGFIDPDRYLVVWPIEEVEIMNKELAVDEFTPGLIFFGSDGGGEGYAFDARNDEMHIVEIPLVGMSLDEATICGKTFYEFLIRCQQDQ